jgi:hypothetical protein
VRLGEGKITDVLTDTKEEEDDRRSRLYKDSNTEKGIVLSGKNSKEAGRSTVITFLFA